MTMSITTRAIRNTDYDQWRPLWDGYNAFYGRSGETALAESTTAVTGGDFSTVRSQSTPLSQRQTGVL
jgi:hypothetical protein